MNFLRRLASLPLLNRLLLRPRVRHLLASVLALRFALAARRTTTPVRLLWNEYVARRGVVETYTVASTGVPVSMQHGRDLEALFELFERGEYEPPDQLRERLAPTRVRRVLDVGANVGMFSAWVTGRWPDAAITAFEPSSESIPVYRTWAAAAGSDATLLEACASNQDGTIEFQEGLGSGSRAASPGEVTGGLSSPGDVGTRSVPTLDVLPMLTEADFVKIDIEGGEWAILADPRLRDVHDLTLVMESHRNLAPSLPAGDAAQALLEQAGFRVVRGAQNFWGHGTLWAAKD